MSKRDAKVMVITDDKSNNVLPLLQETNEQKI
jgi:hypothetical protein